MLEIECSEELGVSGAARPDKRFEALVRCCLQEDEPRDDGFLSAGTVVGLVSGEIVSGSAMRTAARYMSLSSLVHPTQKSIRGRSKRGRPE